MMFWCISSSVLVMAFPYPAAHHAAHKAGGDARRSSGQPAGEDAHGPLLGKSGADSLCQQMPKAQQGHGGTAACKLGQRGIPPDGGKDNARRHVSGQDAGRGQAGQVDEQLPRRADGPAHAERPEIIGYS